jgi:hypothetical protein
MTQRVGVQLIDVAKNPITQERCRLLRLRYLMQNSNE